MRPTLPVLAAILACATPALAQPSPGPQPTPVAQSVPDARDVPYPGTIRLHVDASDTRQAILRVRETIPVAGPGPLTLLYPEWLPGKHAPRGAIDKLAGLTITAGGQKLEWKRDPVEVYAFHIDVPAGASEIIAEFQFVSPTATNQGRIVVTPEMLNLQWEQVALYPAGHFTRQITVEPTVRLPDGWKFGAALDVARQAGAETVFKPTPFETLVDSPMFAGRYFRQVDLDPGGRSPVRLNMVADSPELLEAKPEHIAAHRKLVQQADKLYGARHFDRYDFLLSLTDRMGGIGLEHHRSSENGVKPEYFTEWDKMAPERDLLPHEYTHSWNGKFRRGADLWTPDYRTPMQGSLMWVYEGQTQYWGYVLAARSGLISKQDALDAFAMIAATYQERAGRTWKPLIDTTNDPITIARRPEPWRSWQRGEDYYSEGLLIWLDADSLIRERTGGRKSLDDFAKGFFGVDDGVWTVKTYTFEDVVAALNAVTPYDWTSFLRTRVEKTAPAPLDGVARGGYRLVFADKPSEFQKADDTNREATDLTYSLGVTLDKDADLTAVQWDSPAFKAGLRVSDRVVAINGEAYKSDRLKDAITAAKKDRKPIELLIKSGDRYRTFALPYYDGLRYPKLERAVGAPARLDAILAPRS